MEELSENIKKYIEILEIQAEDDSDELNDLEELYYLLTDEELTYLEVNGFC